MIDDTLLESHLGYVCWIDGGTARVQFEFEDEEDQVYYDMPSSHLHEHEIEAGDDFFLEVYKDGVGKIKPAILYGPKSPEELEHQLESDNW